MVIVPCSTSTLAKINLGIADNLITRAASVAIKEGRKLVLVPREMPLSHIVLRNMKELAEAGVTIMPPMMEFYTRPRDLEEMVSFVTGRILDSLNVEHRLYDGWKG
jgi:4-hydroxy-3-polyprenylbenzoate decarboxylase